MTQADFRTYFRRLYPSLVLYATKILGNDDVEDVVQDAFMEFWKRRDVLSGEAHVKAFLYRSVYTKALNVIKHRNIVNGYAADYLEVEKKRLEYFHPDHNDVAHGLENEELRMRIHNTIMQLPEKRRQVFMMSYVHELSMREIAEIMGISVRTAESHLYKALLFLRAQLRAVVVFFMLIFVCE